MSVRDQGPGDEGLSLIELIFYVVILGLITTGIAILFFNTWKAQASVSDQVDATERGQLVSSQIEKALRNGVAFEVTDTSLATGLTSGPTLVVATAMSGSNACMAFNLAGGTAQLTSTSGARVAAPPWPIWEPGIAQHKTSAGTLVPFFVQSSNDVSYSFDVASANGPTVHFEGTAYMRNTGGTLPGGGPQTCF